MASTPQQETAACDLPRMPHVTPAVNLPPSTESLNRFAWVNAVLQIPTQEFGIPWATETFGPEWQTTRPFLRAVVKKKMRLSKINGQRWVVMVEYDDSELKQGVQYLHDRIEDQGYLKDLLDPKLPVSPAEVTSPPEDAAVPADAGDAEQSVQPPTPSADDAAATKVASSSTPRSVPSKPPAEKRRRGRPKSAHKKAE